MSSANMRSSSTNGTMDRKGFKKDSISGDDFKGSLKCKACEAFISSMARIVSTFLTKRKHLVALLAPILTWSSCPLEETIESTEDGMAKFLFWLAILAAVYCGIIIPLFNPGLLTKNSGKSRNPEIN